MMIKPKNLRSLRLAFSRWIVIVNVFLCVGSIYGQTVPVLPKPTGDRRVGTMIVHLADPSRPDSFDKQHGPREIMLQLWYPADPQNRGVVAPYVASPLVIDEMIKRQYNFQQPATIEAIRKLNTVAIADAPIDRSGPRYPVLLLSHGLGEPRFNYTSLAEELASHGYIVATIDHPYGGLTALPDGRILSTDSDPRGGTDEGAAELTKEWAQDAKFVIDSLTASASDKRGQTHAVAARADLSDVGMLGHSLGGAAALEACRIDERFKACADLDGQAFGQVTVEGVRKPTLIVRESPLYSDADLAKRGRTRETWEQMGREGQKLWARLQPRDPRTPFYMIKIAGTGHMSFSDLAFTMPDTISRFGGKMIDPNRGFTIIATYVRSFFDQYLKRKPSELLTGPNAAYPEVSFDRVSP